ncbi:zinc finger protein 260-like [Lutzomyia longipalpis]|uniref:zinc finger protein 260-like n=1 Tax=Lutzomyia longipalpis TaxID=7200 RepID=UPI002483B933|nr:zinc finger protein 260-like [Lutzomyia longipalpis]
MCRILVYGCGHVNYINTELGETLILCKSLDRENQEDRKENLGTEIFITHTHFPDCHKLTFNEIKVKEEVKDEGECQESVAPFPAIPEGFATATVKEEPEEPIDFRQPDDTDHPTDPLQDTEAADINGFLQNIQENPSIIDWAAPGAPGEKKFHCNRCPKTFSQLPYLTRHMRLHSHSCSKRSASGSKKEETLPAPLLPSQRVEGFLPLHPVEKRVLSRIPPEDPSDGRDFTCTRCFKSFTSPDSLKQHEKIHGDKVFICNICEKGFARKDYLDAHIAVHNKSNRKTYSCNLCDKKYFSRAGLSYHREMHTGVKAFPCPYCRKSFAWKTHALKHIKLHSKTDGNESQN